MKNRSTGGLVLLRLCLLATLPLAACVAVPVQPPNASLLKDALFQPPATAIKASTVFAMTPEMQRYAEAELRPLMQHGDSERALVEALYDKGRLQLEYDAQMTRNAAEAFSARTGNCLSLVIMTGAFAKYFEVPVRYQSVVKADTWSRSGNIAMASGHVNLKLVQSSGTQRFVLGTPGEDDGLTVDFLPSARALRNRVRPISEQIITAMYFNNRAAELLADGDLNAAYWWARESIRVVPAFMEAYNTLAVIYQQRGHLPEAEAVLREVLAREPENTVAMSNLVGVLNTAGRKEESTRLAQRLAAIEPYPPFYFHDQGIAALKAQDFKAAREFFKRELRRAAYEPDTHFGLAIAHLYLGESRAAQKQLGLAINYSTTDRSRALYSAKLDWLKSQGYRAGS